MKPDEHTTRKSRVAYEILAYLVKNPDAGDTIEGIVEWWLLEQRIDKETARVEEAIAELVAKELILGRKGRDSRTHYRINRQKYGEIRKLLKEGSE